jgi:chromosome segregation ATPase
MPRPSITRRIDPAISAKPEWPLSTGKQNISRPDYDAVLERARMGEVAAADAQMLLEAEKSRGAVLRVQARRLRQLVSTAQQRQDTSAHSDTLFESLHTELATARDSMVKQDDALAKAKTGSDALRSQLSAMEMVCSQKDDDIAGLKQRLSNADAHHVAELYNTAAELDAARRSHKEETRHLQHALAAAQSALETANDRISTMEQAETHFEAEQSDPVRNDDAIRKVLAASTSRLAAVEAEASTLAARLQSLATTKSREVVKTEAMRSLESRLDTKSRELAQAQAALIASEEQRTEDYDSYVKVLAEGEAECQRMKAKCQKLKAKMEACVNLEDEMELLRVRLESTKSQLEESQAAYQAETTNLALSKNDLQDARDSHASLSTTLKHTQAEVTDLRLLLVVAREKAKVSQDILQDVRIQAERSGDASLQQVKDLMAQLDAAHDATAVAKCRVADLTLRISDATSALHETRRELSNVESKLAQVTLTAEAQARSLAIRDQRLDEIRRVANDATCESAAYYERTQKKLTQFTKELQEAHGHVFKVTEQLHSHERDCKGLADQLEEARRHISIIESQQSQEKETTVQHNLDITAQLQKARQSSADLVLQLDALQSEHFTILECRQLTIVKLEEELHIKSQLSNDLEREKERARDAENQLAAVTLELHKAGARADLAKERMAEVQRQMNAMSADGSRELAEALNQLTQEQSARNQLVAECNGHRKAVDKLEQQLQAAREAAAEASQHVIAAEQFHRRSQATAQTDLVALRHAHARQVEGLEHQLVEARANDVHAARDQLINELQTVKNEIGARQQAIEQVEHCLEVAQEATKHMTDRTVQAEQARDTLQEQAGDMLVMQRTLTERVQELEPQLVAAKTRCGTLEAKIQSTTENFLAQVRKLEIQLATERDHVGEYTQRVQSLEEELSQSVFQADDLRTRLSETDVRSEATSLELTETANAAKRAAETIEHTMKALRSDVDDLRRQLTCTETVRFALAERQRTVADLEKRLDEAHGCLKQSEDDKQHRLKRAADDLTHSQVEVTHLRAQIDNESAMHNKLVEDLHVQLNKSHEAMAQPQKELNAQVATASRAHQSASPVSTFPPVDSTATLRVVQLQEELAAAQRLMMQLALERDNAVMEKDEVMDRQQEVLLSFERIPAIFKAARMVALSAPAAGACS